MSTTRAAKKTPQREAVITRVLNAPRELVWQAWTDPRQAVQWYGPEEFTTPVCRMDVRPGGRFRLLMRGPDGTECREEGVFRVAREPAQLVSEYTTTLNGESGGTLTTRVTFAPHGHRTKATVRQTFNPDNFTQGAREGWTQALRRLAAHLTSARRPKT